eukprot:jgi/Mesen1/1058/ME000123S00228
MECLVVAGQAAVTFPALTQLRHSDTSLASASTLCCVHKTINGRMVLKRSVTQDSLHVSSTFLRGQPLPNRTYGCSRKDFSFQCIAEAAEGNTLEGKVSGVGSNGTAKPLAADSESVESLRAALSAAEARAAQADKERQDALEALKISEARAESYAQSMVATTEEALSEVESAKEAFKTELAVVSKEKENLEEELVSTKEHAIDLAIKVEQMAAIAVQESTANIAEEMRFKIAEAETEALEAQAQVEERIRKAADETAALVLEEAKATIEEAQAAADLAREQARTAENALTERMEVLDQVARAETLAAQAQEGVTRSEVLLKIAESEANQLRADLQAAVARAEAAESRIATTQAALAHIQVAVEKASREREESTRKALEAMTAASKAREEAAIMAYKSEMASLRAAAATTGKVERVKEQALERRFQALERSLAAAEEVTKAWQKRAFAVEELLRQVKDKGIDVLRQAGEIDTVLNGGRMEVMLGDQSQKWQLLAEGPRRQRPEWLRRKNTAGTKLPPLKVASLDVDVEASVPLELPSPAKVWSIFEHKVSDDEYTREAASREAEQKALEEQRKQLERSLQKKTIKRLRTPDELEDKLESGTGTGREIVFQGFNWESHRRKWYLDMAPRAADLAACGITTIWLPPPTQSVAPQGYMPTDLYNLNSAYGSVDELKLCIQEMHNNDILVLGDVVLNHRCAAKQSKDGIWNIFGGKLAWGPEAIVRDDPNFGGRGNPSSGDIFHAAPNIDHSQEFVRRDIREWMQWLRTEIGYDGWRLDFVRGFWGGHVKEYIEATTPAFSIGEYWDSLAYEGGTVCYNQDAHRQRIINWVNATGGTSSAFDVTTKGILHSALHNEYWRLIDPQGKPPGVMGWWPSRAVTFLENHDTGSTQGHWPFPRDKVMQGYAYILTHPGTVGDNLVVKLGAIDWNPAKQNNLEGSWNRCLDYGADYQQGDTLKGDQLPSSLAVPGKLT